MWDYTETVLDHFRNPRNVGVLEDADGVGQVGSLACGDALKLMIKVDSDEIITDATFQTFGCASAIASSSALTEMVKGMSLEAASQITNRDIGDYLGGLPDQKVHCSVMGREALEAAIENYRTGGTAERELEGKVICRCFGVTEAEITRAINENNLRTVEEVTNHTKAGGGCGGCAEEIEDLLEAAAETKTQTDAEAPSRRMTIVERLKLIQETLDREVRPLLQKDGGDLELVDVAGKTVVVSFRGACSRCQVAEFTMKDVVEAKLREFVDDAIEVEEEK
ncbi:MAG: Fe-S cluster assembly protein NifU [Verrucomicrobia bacterium]|jgi:NifU-like protein|nr:Fe-S cluster assembly protein NifU [Verrucomicrobiota bacterium]